MFQTLLITVTLCVTGKLARLLLQICVIIWTLATKKASVTVMVNASAMKAFTVQTAQLRLPLLKLPQITTLCLTNHSLIKAGANGSTIRLQKNLWTATRSKFSVTEPTSIYYWAIQPQYCQTLTPTMPSSKMKHLCSCKKTQLRSFHHQQMPLLSSLLCISITPNLIRRYQSNWLPTQHSKSAN